MATVDAMNNDEWWVWLVGGSVVMDIGDDLVGRFGATLSWVRTKAKPRRIEDVIEEKPSSGKTVMTVRTKTRSNLMIHPKARNALS